jgi:hypothetical protein
MELVCAKHLLSKGYTVDVEHPLDHVLICDVYGVKGDGTIVVEVETGFIPPKNALDPTAYSQARIISKIARYGNHSNMFALATPLHYIIQIPLVLSKPPRFRQETELVKIKTLCDQYYTNPPVSLDELRYTRLHAIYIMDVDELTVYENDPESYVEKYFHIM